MIVSYYCECFKKHDLMMLSTPQCRFYSERLCIINPAENLLFCWCYECYAIQCFHSSLPPSEIHKNAFEIQFSSSRIQNFRICIKMKKILKFSVYGILLANFWQNVCLFEEWKYRTLGVLSRASVFFKVFLSINLICKRNCCGRKEGRAVGGCLYLFVRKTNNNHRIINQTPF